MTHPVQFLVEPPASIPRAQVVIRVVLLVAVMTLALSSIYWCLYLAAPALVALAVTKAGGARYLTEDGPPLVRVLRWLAAAHAYLWFLSNELPTSGASRVDLRIATGGAPTVGSALARLLTSLPAVLLVAVLYVGAGLVWLAAVVTLLVTERMPRVFADFLALTLRVELRLVAYHLSLVERYPSLEAPPVPEKAQP